MKPALFTGPISAHHLSRHIIPKKQLFSFSADLGVLDYCCSLSRLSKIPTIINASI